MNRMLLTIGAMLVTSVVAGISFVGEIRSLVSEEADDVAVLRRGLRALWTATAITHKGEEQWPTPQIALR